LRYDGTVGLSRYVAGHLNNLVFPFRASQFSKRYRGERAQRGRYREFYQMDMDIMGVNSLSVNYDAEIISVIQRTLNSVAEFIGDNEVRIGSRPFWDALFDYLEMDDNQKKDVFVLIDKKDKMGDADFAEGLKDALNDSEKEDKIKSVFINGYSDFLNLSDKLNLAIAELNDFMRTLELFGVKNAVIDLSIARGLAYYTGLVFEFKSLKYPELGTVAGGGRYADLAGKFSKTKIIGVGAAIGFSRIFVALMEAGLIDLTVFESPIGATVLCIGNENLSYSVSVLNALRDEKIASVAYLEADKKFKNQIEYADKIKTKFCVIIGEDEVKNQVVALKNMQTGEQQSVSVMDAIKTIKAI
jgi:histidyl-tRNA synthetase